MKVNKIDHICIAVKNLDEAKKVWEPLMGKGPDGVKEYLDQYVYGPKTWNDYLQMMDFKNVLQATINGRGIYND